MFDFIMNFDRGLDGVIGVYLEFQIAVTVIILPEVLLTDFILL